MQSGYSGKTDQTDYPHIWSVSSILHSKDTNQGKDPNGQLRFPSLWKLASCRRQRFQTVHLANLIVRSVHMYFAGLTAAYIVGPDKEILWA